MRQRTCRIDEQIHFRYLLSKSLPVPYLEGPPGEIQLLGYLLNCLGVTTCQNGPEALGDRSASNELSGGASCSVDHPWIVVHHSYQLQTCIEVGSSRLHCSLAPVWGSSESQSVFPDYCLFLDKFAPNRNWSNGQVASTCPKGQLPGL